MWEADKGKYSGKAEKSFWWLKDRHFKRSLFFDVQMGIEHRRKKKRYERIAWIDFMKKLLKWEDDGASMLYRCWSFDFRICSRLHGNIG